MYMEEKINPKGDNVKIQEDISTNLAETAGRHHQWCYFGSIVLIADPPARSLKVTFDDR
jgi:hypothetical protein